MPKVCRRKGSGEGLGRTERAERASRQGYPRLSKHAGSW